MSEQNPPPTVEPITPDEAIAKKGGTIHPYYLRAINEMIVEHLDSTGKRSEVKHKEIDARALKIFQENGDSEITTEEFHRRGWVHFEAVYRKSGWVVESHWPDYTESFSGYYVFSKRRI